MSAFRLSLDLARSASRTPILIGALGEDQCARELERAERVLPMIDAGIPAHHEQRIQGLLQALGAEVLTPVALPAGEDAKTLDVFSAVIHSALAQGADRGTRVVAVGGGAVLDAAQFAAAVLLRGVRCCVVPTTLLSQVDAAIGGKCGLDFGANKNQIGVIRQPEALFVDPAFPGTLPEEEVRSGLGELAKTALLAGGSLLEGLRALPADRPLPGTDLLRDAIAFKVGVVQRDPEEHGERIVLNAGHTVGHALESAALDCGQRLPHGVAVALGLRAETRHFAPKNAPLVDALLDALRLPAQFPAWCEESRISAHFEADKKRRGRNWSVPVIEGPGRTRVVSATLDDCRAALRTLRSLA